MSRTTSFRVGVRVEPDGRTIAVIGRATKWQRAAEAASRGKSTAERAAIFVAAYQLEFGKTEMPRQIRPIAERLTALRLGGKP